MTDSDDYWALFERITKAIYDPGIVTTRGDNEALYQWQARAVLDALKPVVAECRFCGGERGVMDNAEEPCTDDGPHYYLWDLTALTGASDDVLHCGAMDVEDGGQD